MNGHTDTDLRTTVFLFMRHPSSSPLLVCILHPSLHTTHTPIDRYSNRLWYTDGKTRQATRGTAPVPPIHPHTLDMHSLITMMVR
mmetsp:Transcript_24390/g.70368  ORF Transcript_24390/g.70368 Transcript_24390/m.70368 type:complete len:85 (+) Transcript_24390:107-361(+)